MRPALLIMFALGCTAVTQAQPARGGYDQAVAARLAPFLSSTKLARFVSGWVCIPTSPN